MDAEATVRAYYDAVRSGKPLAPFFARDESTVKFGIGERLYGYSAIERGLQQQTKTTTEWKLESDRLLVTECDSYAWFSDEVFMAWTAGDGTRREFQSRWSGTVARRPDAPWEGSPPETPWRFVGMHVSAPGET